MYSKMNLCSNTLPFLFYPKLFKIIFLPFLAFFWKTVKESFTLWYYILTQGVKPVRKSEPHQVALLSLNYYFWGLDLKPSIQLPFGCIDFYTLQVNPTGTSAPSVAVTFLFVLKSSEITESSYSIWWRKSIKYADELLQFLDHRLLFLISREKKSCSIWTLPFMTPFKALKLKSIRSDLALRLSHI